MGDSFAQEHARVSQLVLSRAANLSSLQTTSTPEIVANALDSLPSSLPAQGIGLTATTSLLLDHVAPALSGGHAGPRFFGLVTGGCSEIAHLADNLVTSYDACVQVHLPDETISTILEAQTLSMLLQLLSLPDDRFKGNTLTSGATTSNVLALTLAREQVLHSVHARHGRLNYSAADSGSGGIDVAIYCAVAHASVAKSASIIGIGRNSVVDCTSAEPGEACAFDLEKLERLLQANVGIRGSVVVASFGEVNTGGFEPRMPELRRLCDLYDAWLHIDAGSSSPRTNFANRSAFGAFAVLLPQFAHLQPHLALADSITLDSHKVLNTPYAGGILFSRSLPLLLSVTGPGSTLAPYLAAPTSTAEPSSIDQYRAIPSPLHVNLENSRRFIALPIWATLLSYGRDGLTTMVDRMCRFTCSIERWMRAGGAGGGYEVLLPSRVETFNILLFAPSSTAPAIFQGLSGASELSKALNKSREIYFTGTSWRGRGAVRMAVSNWCTGVDGQDERIVLEVLERVMREARARE